MPLPIIPQFKVNRLIHYIFIYVLVSFALVLGSATGQVAGAEQMGPEAAKSEEEKILSVAQTLFEAVNKRDQALWRSVQIEGGVTINVRQGRNGKSAFRMLPVEDVIARVGPVDHTYKENWTSEPVVLIRGPIAVVWGEYSFWIDGKFSHCGVDSLDLVKQNGEWKVANLMWTVEIDCKMTTPEVGPSETYE